MLSRRGTDPQRRLVSDGTELKGAFPPGETGGALVTCNSLTRTLEEARRE